MEKKTIFTTIATIALMVQVLMPIWWGAIWASFYYFWVEGIIEGGILGTERVTGVDKVGESIIGKCFIRQSCSFSSLLWGIFSIYAILALIVAIKTLLIKNDENQVLIYAKWNTVYLIINIFTILLSIFFIYWNGGLIPKL